ncbi:hypothetical protein IW261DRAFT_1678028 [Armillaria novae-zelandiae]|uniref:Uncharacterized protein n=1 Tax=Armillaria novae-zelandiae TaxID=153914 RepID=A0AA39PFB8_9AGAR|nr:hypothetical protein IW261DRAFT_1678028 [Armillaria novae-zelandiae]
MTTYLCHCLSGFAIAHQPHGYGRFLSSAQRGVSHLAIKGGYKRIVKFVDYTVATFSSVTFEPSSHFTALVNGDVVGGRLDLQFYPSTVLVYPPVRFNSKRTFQLFLSLVFLNDMQEREFQITFAFSPEFEVATFKVPNREYPSYGGINGVDTAGRCTTTGSHYPQAFNGSNDPYNLVIVKQGGVVADATLRRQW